VPRAILECRNFTRVGSIHRKKAGIGEKNPAVKNTLDYIV
jgi:hypothetical protein